MKSAEVHFRPNRLGAGAASAALCVIVLALSLSSCLSAGDFSRARGFSSAPAIIPLPVAMEPLGGDLKITGESRLVYRSGKLARLAEVVVNEIAHLTPLRLASSAGEPRSGDIVLSIEQHMQAEQYVLEVDEAVTIRGGSPDAVALGTVTLLQTMRASDGEVRLPRLTISDRPAAGYRALMIDVAREPHTITTLKQAVLLCRWYKIKYLHLHLSDNEGFTFPSTAYPQIRSADRDQQGKRHFSLEELRGLEQFASERGVTIIPEIEMPGHSLALLWGMPEAFGGPPRELNHQAICVSNERVYAVLDTVIGEICDVFRSTPYLHIGADEVNYDNWKHCPDAKGFMAAHNLADYQELYRYFIVRMNEVVKKHGKKTIIWEGFHKDGKVEIPRDIIVEVFESYYNTAPDLIADGYDVINASWQPIYVVPSRKWLPEYIYTHWNIYRWEHFWENSKAYGEGIQVAPTEKVLGASMCSWENSDEAEIPDLRERIAAMSERVWNPGADQNWADFAARLESTDEKLTLLLPVTGEAVRPGWLERVTAVPYAPPGRYMKDHCFVVKDGAIHLFAPLGRRGTSWEDPGSEESAEHITSGEMVNWHYRGTAVPASGRDRYFDKTMGGIAPTVIQHDGKYLMFYSGWSFRSKRPHFNFSDGRQSIGLAVSTDLITWVKPEEFARDGLKVDGTDPCVVQDEANKRWVMYTIGDDILVWTSDDLLHWSATGVALRAAELKGGVSDGNPAESPFVMQHPLSSKWIIILNGGFSVSDNPLRFPPIRPHGFKSGWHVPKDGVRPPSGAWGDGTNAWADEAGTGFAHEVFQYNGQWFLTGVVGRDGKFRLKFTPIEWTVEAFRLRNSE